MRPCRLAASVLCLAATFPVAILAVPPAGRWPWPRGPYLGATLPVARPAVFAPGLVGTGLAERDVAMAPDGRELFFSVSFRTISTIMGSRVVGGRWSPPEVAGFAADARFFHMEPCVSPDGRRVFFLTNRPRPGEAARPGWANQAIWAADRQADGTWSDPVDLGEPINDSGLNYFPSVARDGSLYFTRTAGAGSRPAIYHARRDHGRFEAPERLPDAVNGYKGTFNAFVAPDETYLIAAVEGHPQAAPTEKASYVVFFRLSDGGWSTGTNLGPAINVPGNTAFSPYVSPDGRALFFASNVPVSPMPASLRGLTLGRLLELNEAPGNGNSDILWVSADVIRTLRTATAGVLAGAIR